MPSDSPSLEKASEGCRRTASVYRLRPAWRLRVEPDVFVPASLYPLGGKTGGIVDPPVYLYWQPGTLDFGADADLRRFYASALPAIATAEDFATWINASALRRLWPRLALPRVVRVAWETIHPELRDESDIVNARLKVQDAILAAIADVGFALAGGSALLDYDVITRDTEDIDAFLNSTSVAAFTAAVEAVVAACASQGWASEIVMDQDWNKKILITLSDGTSTIVQLVHHQRSAPAEKRPGGGLRLIFSDVVAGKAVALADSARGRDFDDIAHIVNTPGWSLADIEVAMESIRYGDLIPAFRNRIARFRAGDFDQDIRDEGFDPEFTHQRLDHD